MITNLQTHLREAGMEDKRHTMHYFRVGRAASHNMDGTTMDPVVEYVGWSPEPSHAEAYSRGTASAAAAGVKRSRETAFIEAAALPLSKTVCTSIHSVPRGQLRPRGESRSLGIVWTTKIPRKGY